MMITTTLQKHGTHQCIAIPDYLITALNWQQCDNLLLDAKNNCLIIKQVHVSSPKTINDLFKNFKGNYTPSEIDWGKAEGAEIW